MKQISGKDFARLLQQKGWELKRINGSHHIFAKSGHIERISVPVHGNQPLKVGLLRHQVKIPGASSGVSDPQRMKIAGIHESEL